MTARRGAVTHDILLTFIFSTLPEISEIFVEYIYILHKRQKAQSLAVSTFQARAESRFHAFIY